MSIRELSPSPGGEPGEPQSPKRCAVCAARRSVAVFLYRRDRWSTGNGDSSHPTGLPPTYLCYECLQRVVAERLKIGWCDEGRCRRWGPMGTASPCGRPYSQPEGWVEVAN